MRRPAAVALTLAACALLAACGSSPREAPAPPPITSSVAATPAPVASPTGAPARTPSTPPSPAAVASEAGRPQPPAPPTVTTSAPGAIPPQPAPDASAPAEAKPADPLKWLQDRQARKAEYDRRLVDAQAAVDGAQRDVADWQRMILEIKNPFLPRPQLSADDAEATKGMTNAERVKWAEGRLSEAQAKLSAAQKALDELKSNPVTL